MKKFLAIIGASSLAIVSSNVLAATYVGSRTAGTATADLSITTDGTVGALSQANILDWTIQLHDGVDNFTLRGPLSGGNSQLLLSGTALTATVTDLLFNFSASGSQYALFQSPSVGSGQLFYCPQSNGCFDFAGAGEGIDAHTDFSYQRNSLTGNVVLASVARVDSAVPEPATWAMMLVGFGAIGFGMRRNQRQTVSYRFA